MASTVISKIRCWVVSLHGCDRQLVAITSNSGYPPRHRRRAAAAGRGSVVDSRWESIQEILHWLSQPGLAESVQQSKADVAAGRTCGEDEIRAEYQLPRRPR